jgi:hypothetical protein
MIFPVNPEISQTDLYYSNDITYANKGYRGLNIFGKIKFTEILSVSFIKMVKFHRSALKNKECYIGPFWGELGNFLLHFLPYVSFLKRQGVKINVCCAESYLSFMVDDSGTQLFNERVPLPDFFEKARPFGNSVKPPVDVMHEFKKFQNKAAHSGLPFLDLSDNNLYWYVFRNWQLNGKQAIFQIENVFGNKEEKNNVIIFPRKKGGEYTLNNGGEWDYMKLARAVSPFFDNVIFTGRPAMSAEVMEEANIKLQLSDDNTDVLKSCANAKLIITQHSGAMHIGSYVNVPVLLIFKGKLPIKGLDDSDRFRKNIGRKKVFIAFSEEEIKMFLKEKQYLA